MGATAAAVRRGRAATRQLGTRARQAHSPIDHTPARPPPPCARRPRRNARDARGWPGAAPALDRAPRRALAAPLSGAARREPSAAARATRGSSARGVAVLLRGRREGRCVEARLSQRAAPVEQPSSKLPRSSAVCARARKQPRPSLGSAEPMTFENSRCAGLGLLRGRDSTVAVFGSIDDCKAFSPGIVIPRRAGRTCSGHTWHICAIV
jgi:hypothetical protein